LIAELKAASHVVIGAPMYNFSIPSTLRTWFDHVLRPGTTFSYSAAGPTGLIDDKPVIVIESRGGIYSEGPGVAADFQEPYLRQLLGFIGLTDVRFVRVEKIGFGPEARQQSIEQAIASLPQVVGEPIAA
ncbi:MAG: NAD(P)H-dependent oxidoreductase, partial [Steroidobacteraceae bacterium]